VPASPDGDAICAYPQPRLNVKDALSICLAMIGDDESLRQTATSMWHALSPFVAALTQAEADVSLAALQALGGPDPPRRLRELRRRAARQDLVDVVCVLDEWLARGAARRRDDAR
jgi:hypothetical protein